MTPRTVSTVAALAAGMAVGSASSSLTWRATPIGSRNPPIIRSRSVATVDGAGGIAAASTVAGSRGGGPGASRSKSRYCNDISTPPSPSVIVWCIFDTSADLPPRNPSTTTNCHSGRVRSNGSTVISVARSSSWRIVPGLGRAMWRTWWSMSNSGSSTHSGADRLTGAGCTRQRSRGTFQIACSIRARNRSTSGGRSRIETVPNVDDRKGSFSRRHIRPSASLILRSGRSATDRSSHNAAGTGGVNGRRAGLSGGSTCA